MGDGIVLVLGGGGARGIAHVGVLEVLDAHGIPVRAVAGTSMGGLVGALLAAGMSTVDLVQNVKKYSRPTEVLKLVDPGFGIGGLSLKGAKLYTELERHLEGVETFSDLSVPFAVVAVDLKSGREVVLDRGPVADAVRATVSVPGLFAPVELEGMELVDGGQLDNVPVGVGRRLASGPVVAVDVLPSFAENQPGRTPVQAALQGSGLPGFFNRAAHLRLVMISAMTALRLERDPPEVLIRPRLPDDVTPLIGFHRADELLAAGRLAAESALPEIQAALMGRELGSGL